MTPYFWLDVDILLEKIVLGVYQGLTILHDANVVHLNLFIGNILLKQEINHSSDNLIPLKLNIVLQDYSLSQKIMFTNLTSESYSENARPRYVFMDDQA